MKAYRGDYSIVSFIINLPTRLRQGRSNGAGGEWCGRSGQHTGQKKMSILDKEN